MAMQIRRTLTANNPPTALAEGQLAVEMASTPPKLWVGVPVAISSNQRVQLNDVSSQLAGYLPLTGGTLTGALTGTVTTGTAATFTNNHWASPTLTVVQQAAGFAAIQATGSVTVNGLISSIATGGYNYLSVSSDWLPYLRLQNTGGTTGAQTIIDSQFMGVVAWSLGMTYENFIITRSDLLGTFVDNPLVIDRTTGITSLTDLNLAGQAVTLGDPDSGGTGYRCLRVPN